MKTKKRLAALVMAVVMALLPASSAVMAADESVEDSAIEAGTYTVPVDVDDSVNGQDFGAVVSDTAVAVINSDGSVSYTLSFEPVTVMVNWQGWVSEFYGWYDGDTLAEDFDVTYTTIEDENGDEQTAVDTVTFTAEKADSYVLSYYLSSNVMSFTREKTMTVDWDNAVEGIVEEESEPVTYTGTATVDGYYYDLSVSVTVLDGVITALEVTSEEVYAGEHDGSIIYYEDAAETLEESLIGVAATKSALEGVDAVSGATMTGDAIIEAVLDALGLSESDDVLDIDLEAGAVYSVEITYKAAAHSLVSDPEATADDGTDTVTADIVVDTGGQAAIVIEFYNSEAMYITSYNGLHLGGTADGELTTENAVIYTAENEELKGGTCVTEVTIPLDNLYSTYYTSVSVYVPDMYNVDMDGDGEIDEGYFTVDPSTLTVDWDTLTQISYSDDGGDDTDSDADNDTDTGDADADDDSYDYTQDILLGFHTVSAEYTGTGAYEGMDRLLYAVGRYFGYRVGLQECEDGTWNVILYFGGEIGYNSAIGDITVYESADMADAGTVYSNNEDLVYIINVQSPGDPIYCSLYVGGSMNMTVTYAILPASDEFSHIYTSETDEEGNTVFTCSVCGSTYTEYAGSGTENEEKEENQENLNSQDNQNTEEENQDGTTEEENQSGTTEEENRDGTTEEENRDGTAGEENQSGTTEEENRDGTAGEENQSGTAGEENQSGTTEEENRDGTSEDDDQSETGEDENSTGVSEDEDDEEEESDAVQSTEAATGDSSNVIFWAVTAAAAAGAAASFAVVPVRRKKKGAGRAR